MTEINAAVPHMWGSYYITPTGLSQESIEALLIEANHWDNFLGEGLTQGPQGQPNRRSKVAWLPSDHWVAGMMAHLVHTANRQFFKANLTEWASPIQYTYYDGGSKDFYNWHADTRVADYDSEEIRKISISLLLSDPVDYEGGELQLHNLNDLTTLKPPLGTAVIFSSQTPHRVRPVKKGIRRSLVGWFGGPTWK